jgi:putative phage-type endonuclease
MDSDAETNNETITYSNSIYDTTDADDISENDDDFIDLLPEDLLIEMEDEVLKYIDDMINSNILQISNPLYEEKITSRISDIMYEACSNINDGGMFNTSYDDIIKFVKQCVITYTQTIMIPRSCDTSLYLNNIDDCENNDLLMSKLEILRKSNQPQQKTPEWYTFRHNLITASNLGKIIGSDARKNSLIYEKCKPIEIHDNNTNVNSPMHWGNKYEPVTIRIYEHKFSTKIEDFGCIQHPLIKCIGSSPDGINIDPTNTRFCRMIEVKNIFSRNITGIPQHDYWVQCQVQMEVCNLDYCDFIETRIKECEENEFYNETHNNTTYKGIILYFVSKTDIYYKPYYVYMPLQIERHNKIVVDDWILETQIKMNPTHILHETLYWYLHEISVILIPRNKLWFQALIPTINETWNTIIKERISGFEHRAPKKKNTKVQK